MRPTDRPTTRAGSFVIKIRRSARPWWPIKSLKFLMRSIVTPSRNGSLSRVRQDEPGSGEEENKVGARESPDFEREPEPWLKPKKKPSLCLDMSEV